jgi:hypothetical protein
LRWDDVEDKTVKEGLDIFAADEDALDTVDDILLLRSLILKMVNQQDELVEAMLKWAEDNGEKPREAPTFAPIVTALDKLSSMIEKETKRRAQGGMTMSKIAMLLNIVGEIIESHVRDETTLRSIRDDLIRVNLHALTAGK